MVTHLGYATAGLRHACGARGYNAYSTDYQDVTCETCRRTVRWKALRSLALLREAQATATRELEQAMTRDRIARPDFVEAARKSPRLT